MEEITIIEVLQTWNPSLKNQESLNEMLAVYEAFKFLPKEQVPGMSKIAQKISKLWEKGEADIEIQIRDGKVIGGMYGERERY